MRLKCLYGVHRCHSVSCCLHFKAFISRPIVKKSNIAGSSSTSKILMPFILFMLCSLLSWHKPLISFFPSPPIIRFYLKTN
ncbi:Hypothetical protein A7A1_0132 [Bacillus subtilis subsp. subtilis str. BSP1]|nr:Hypothetical protein A7A1_0132 [Bacillus subtilis subsp. subtilis str. BSP1]